MKRRLMLTACLAGAAMAAAMAATGATQGWVDVLDQPAVKSPLAARGLINGMALAGKRVIAAGQRGHILYSDDAGETWKQADVPVSSDLVSVHFPTPQKGWAAGHDGVILHSSDGGQHWTKQRDGRPDAADVPVLDVWFEDERNGYAVGAFGLLLRTADGGAKWESVQNASDNPKSMHLYSVRGVGGDIYAVGEQGLVLKLDRASSRFNALTLPYNGTLFGITGTTGALVVHGLRGNVLRSTDGGTNWQAVATQIPVGLTAATVDVGGRIVLASQAGHLLASSDNGANFAPVKLERPFPAAAVLSVAPGRLLVAGPRGIQAQPLP
ncbi:YCF48-related protein [Ramlibacter solisilvae]|uniref:Glycosyl hydrolase n=1 Tax=Ramlibacter tataouinensis TaxID=94132 RepID=A0A127JYR5_9BURK|nr:YCF48-related protein [Ramlibacter tataouinensis]AMO25054.1 glycosyl hydrolase [Ramlibacter tataouinensis]